MVASIVYHSKTGSCERYAKELSRALHLPAYELGKAPTRADGQVIYIGWAMAGKLVGLKKAMQQYDVAGAVLVGMSPVYPGSVENAKNANGLSPSFPLFVRQGGFHMNRLSGPMKLIMKLKCREIATRLAPKKGSFTPAEQALYTMATTGEGEPPAWDVSDIALFFNPDGGGLHQTR